MTRKEILEEELKELKEYCEQARENLKENFKENSFELLQEILDNRTKYFVHDVKFSQTFEKNELCSFNRVCLYVHFQDNGIMYISLPISEKEQEE